MKIKLIQIISKANSNIKRKMIFIFLLFLITKVQTVQIFKVIYSYERFYFFITQQYIALYNMELDNINTLIEFNDNPIITTEKELEMISVGRFKYNSEPQNLMVIKNYIYSLSNNAFFCQKTINGIEGYSSQVIPFKCTDSLCYYIIGFINSNKILYLDLYEASLSNCEPNNKVSSLNINNIGLDYINCQIMKSASYDEVLTCFYRNSNSKDIIASSFSIDMTSKNLNNITSLYSSKETNGAKIIKSILSEDETKAYVCFINDDNNCDCLIYNIITNEWSNYNTYLNNCLSKLSSLFFDYYDITNEFFLYCFESESEINLIKLNKNFELISIDDHNIYDGIKDCLEYIYSSLIYDSTKITIFSLCDNDFNVYEIGEYTYDIPTTKITTIKKTILTTIPTTLINTIKSTIFETFPMTRIQTTEQKTIQSNMLTTNIISTIIQKLNPSTIIKTSSFKSPSFLTSTISNLLSSSINHYKENETIIIQEKSNKTKEEIIGNLNEVMKDYDIGKVYEIFGDEYNIKISPINTNSYKNISTYIDFSNCENILRASYGLSSSSILTVYQLEIDNKNEQSLINDVEYAVFDENKNQLSLSVCKDEIIEINYQLDTSKINISKVYYYAELGIDVFNIEHEFFNDICFSYSENGSDMILTDRISDIYENYSVCENNCKYDKVNLTQNTVSCKCTVKTYVDAVVEPPRLYVIIRDSFKDSNVAVIKCFNLVFNYKNKAHNIGFWIFTFLILLHIPFFIQYFASNINPIKTYIFNEMTEFNYIYKIFNPTKKRINRNNNNNIKIHDSRLSILKSINVDNKKLNGNINKNGQKKKKKNFHRNSKIRINTSINKDEQNNNKFVRKNLKTKTVVYNNIQNSPIFKFDNKVYNQNYIDQKEKNFREDTDKNLPNYKEDKIILSPKYYSLINIDANNSKIVESQNSNFLLDTFDFNTAIKYDKRKFCKIFYICILTKENIINIIFFKTPLDLFSLRFCLFIFIYSSDLAFNTIFYSNENISEKYHYKGNSLFIFSLINNLIQSLISSIVSIILVNSFQHMIDSRNHYEDVFKEEEIKMRKNKNYKVNKEIKLKIIDKIRLISSKLKYKIILFIIIEFTFMLFFYYFVTAFCEVYKQTQISWLYDFFLSFLISLAAEILGSLLIAIFYIVSLKYKLKILYQIIIFLYNI